MTKPMTSDSEGVTKEIECNYCGGSGRIEVAADNTNIMYGKHIIGKDWKKLDDVFIWFLSLKRGIPGYVYETSSGKFMAPFRGELVSVIKDTRNEFREVSGNDH